MSAPKYKSEMCSEMSVVVIPLAYMLIIFFPGLMFWFDIWALWLVRIHFYGHVEPRFQLHQLRSLAFF